MDPLSQYAEQGISNSSTPYSRSPSPSFQPPGNVDQNDQDMQNGDEEGDQDLQPPPTSSVFNLSSYDLKAEGLDDVQGVGEEVKVTDDGNICRRRVAANWTESWICYHQRNLFLLFRLV